MASPRTRRKRVVFIAVILCASVVVALSLLEGFTRIFGLAPPLPKQYRAFIDDPCLPFRKKPNIVERGTSASKEYKYEYRHNSQGFRDDEHSIEKPDGVFRILALGDSFTWGVGARYEDTYLVRLETWLNERGDNHPKVEIIKAGVPRYFPEIQRLLLENYGIAYRPDLILVAFLPNDVADTALGIEALRPTSQDGYLLSKRAEMVGPLGAWLYIHSHVARAVLSSVFANLESSATETRSAEDTAASVRHPAWEKIRQEYTRMKTIAAEWQPAWEKIRQEYTRMKAIADNIGATFVLVHIPQADLSPEHGLHLIRLMQGRFDAFIDTQPHLRSASEESRRNLYWPKDRHCNADGYTVIARVLFDHLTRRGLVP